VNQVKKTSMILIVVLLTLSCQGCVSSLFYQPDRKLYDTPDRHGLKYEEVFFRSKDGTPLGGVFSRLSASRREP
jgi:hypothetical protein